MKRKHAILAIAAGVLLGGAAAFAVQAGWYGPIHTTWTRTGTAIGSLSDVGDPIGRYGKGGHVSVTVLNSGANALADFAYEVRNEATQSWHTILSGNDWSTPSATLPLVSTVSPATLGAGAESHFVLNVYGADAIRFRAQASGGSTTVVLGGTFEQQPNGS